MRKIIKLTESDLTRIVKRIIKEQETSTPFKVGEVIKMKNDKDGKTYTVKIDKIPTSSYLIATLSGGDQTRNGNKELDINSDGTLSGNMEFGKLTKI